MISLHVLRGMVGVQKVEKKVPRAAVLKKSGVPVIVRKDIGNRTEILVYANGFVVYRVGKHVTVFTLQSCGGYLYESDDDYGQELSEDFFEEKEWYLRLVLEGEDRIANNRDINIGSRRISYSAVAEDWEELKEEDRMLDHLIEREMIEELFQYMNEQQRFIIEKYYFDQLTQTEIGDALGISNQAVSDIRSRIIQRIRRKYGVKEFLLRKGDK